MDSEAMKRVYIDKFEARIKGVESELDKLREKAASASAEARDTLVRNLDALVEKEKIARQKLDQYRSSGTDRLEVLTMGLEEAWDMLRDSLELALKN